MSIVNGNPRSIDCLIADQMVDCVLVIVTVRGSSSSLVLVSGLIYRRSSWGHLEVIACPLHSRVIMEVIGVSFIWEHPPPGLSAYSRVKCGLKF